jgi:hypothetical protein
VGLFLSLIHFALDVIKFESRFAIVRLEFVTTLMRSAGVSNF